MVLVCRFGWHIGRLDAHMVYSSTVCLSTSANKYLSAPHNWDLEEGTPNYSLSYRSSKQGYFLENKHRFGILWVSLA